MQSVIADFTADTFDMAVPTIATLTERVDNHIKFFWRVVGAGFLWLATLSLLLYHINDTANRIVADQTGLKNDLINQSLTIYSAMPPEQFKTTLPDIASTIAKARERRLAAPPQVVNELQSKLVSAETTAPAYWLTAAAFINYRSAMLVGGDSNKWISLPPCHAADITKAAPDDESKHHLKTSILMVSSDCYWVLDDRPLRNMVFRHALIIYDGGPVALEGITFEDCLFEFRVQQPPPTKGEYFTRAVLASDFHKVEITEN